MCYDVCGIIICDYCHSVLEVTQEDVLKALQKDISSEIVHIEVRRSSLLDDALRAAGKKKFDPVKSLKVCNNYTFEENPSLLVSLHNSTQQHLLL